MRARRDAVAPAEAFVAAQNIADRFIEFLNNLDHAFDQATIAAYCAFGSEIDLAPLLGRLDAAGYRLALPRMTGKLEPLTFHAYRPGQTLIVNDHDILEPEASTPVVQSDIILTPLLAFDRQHFRLGYGGGYYDRTLALHPAATHPTRPLAIGVGYSWQQVESVPVGRYDRPLDFVIAETSMF